ncbi:MAG TPA: permease prefix domain 1-containing protein [Candidatus Acidoferrum sp.]|nr:permease prefix domain 1-containing protein [Candidatus Acidoferrum sp.]
MFNLEQSIAEWRKQMLAAGIKSPVPLEELEGHLREEIEAQLQSGMTEGDAFEMAVKQIGKAEKLRAEFGGTNLLDWLSEKSKKTPKKKYGYKSYLKAGAILLFVIGIANFVVVDVFHVHLKYFWEGAYGGCIYSSIFGLIKCAYKAKHSKTPA